MSALDYQKVSLDKQLYAFEVDDVLYEKRDYVLQVYYLFANFVEFTESKPISKELLEYMKSIYEDLGEEQVLPHTLSTFNLNPSYQENFERLYANAQLPLRLLLLDATKVFIKKLIDKNKNVCILTKGNPIVQLNKLKHLDWEGLDKNVKVYFVDELLFRKLNPNSYLAQDFQLKETDIEYVEK